MITLNTRKLSELADASGAAVCAAVLAVRDDVDNCRVDAQHQKDLKAVRETDDLLINTVLINNHETMESTVEFLLGELLDTPADEDPETVYAYLHKVRTIKQLLQYGD